jgi:hypothetical protein
MPVILSEPTPNAVILSEPTPSGHLSSMRSS